MVRTLKVCIQAFCNDVDVAKAALPALRPAHLVDVYEVETGGQPWLLLDAWTSSVDALEEALAGIASIHRFDVLDVEPWEEDPDRFGDRLRDGDV